MKSPADALTDVAARLRRTWSDVVAGAAWAPDFPLGTSALTGRRLAESWPDVHRAALAWEDWVRAAGPGVRLARRAVTVHGTSQTVPAALSVDSIETACHLVGDEWAGRVARGRVRHAWLVARFPDLDQPSPVLRAADGYSDVDFDLLCRAAGWFRSPHPPGLTARQVPVEGMGTKWLHAHESLVRRLAAVDSLDLEPGRPSRVHLTYLDPDHLAGGGRRHDVATAGDADVVAYRPRIVLVSENRDTAQLFPEVPGGIAIEGEGRGAGAVAALPWIRAAATLWYWGDMDADGLEILDGFRAAGVPAMSILMDPETYDAWEQFGTNVDKNGKPLGTRPARPVPHLTDAERTLYHQLISPDWTRHRRVEQERIPLTVALDQVLQPAAPHREVPTPTRPLRTFPTS
jgi:hypothetical protein